MVALVEALIGKGCDVRILDHDVALTRLIGATAVTNRADPHIASLMSNTDHRRHPPATPRCFVIGNAGIDAARVLERRTSVTSS